MTYIINNGIRNLNYFYPNNGFNGEIKDIIGFSNKSFKIFPTRIDAHNYIRYMFECHKEMTGDLKLSIKLFRILENLNVSDRE